MSLFNLLFRDKLHSSNPNIVSEALVDELENLTQSVSAWCQVNHNEDGTHNTRITSGLDLIPVGGMIRWFSTTSIPTGWLYCNGSPISRAAYPKLFQTIGISSGAGDGSTTFNLPTVANFIILAA